MNNYKAYLVLLPTIIVDKPYPAFMRHYGVYVDSSWLGYIINHGSLGFIWLKGSDLAPIADYSKDCAATIYAAIESLYSEVHGQELICRSITYVIPDLEDTHVPFIKESDGCTLA